ncbi:MAG: hypothetical protein P8171_25095 [Candidatus Thiodiazotropha sp.]
MNININAIIRARNIKELQSFGSYVEIKNCIEKEIGSKLGATGWGSLFEKIHTLKESISSNKDNLNSLCYSDSIKESRDKISTLLDLKIKAKNWNDLRRKVDKIISIFSNTSFDAYEYYERTKLEKFKNSSKLEGIEVEIPDKETSIESILEKYKR